MDGQSLMPRILRDRVARRNEAGHAWRLRQQAELAERLADLAGPER